jgi:hypothetical protein
MRTTSSWRYELAPSESGRLTIGPARVRVGRRELRTAPVSVMVGSGALSPPGRNADPVPAPRPRPRRRLPGGMVSPFDDLFGRSAEPEPSARGGQSGFVKVTADKRKVYEGEQVTVEWWLYLSDAGYRYQPITEPRTDGFWIEELPVPSTQGNISLAPHTHEGQSYLAAPIIRRALFPLKTGTLTITPLEAEISQVDLFGRTMRGQRLQADPLQIEVLPLPRAGQPPGFDPAAVGKLSMQASLDRAQVAVGEAVTLTVTVSGQGNLRKLSVPRLPALNGFRAYEPKVDLKLDTGGASFGGSKVIEHLLLPERPGTVTVPALELAYFDPATRKYEVARTEPLRMVVTGEPSKASGTAAASGRASASTGIENVLSAEIRPARERAELRRDLGTTLYRSRGFFWAVLLPPLAFGVTAAVQRFRRRLGQDTEGSRRRQARRLVRRHLRAAQVQLDAGNTAAFYVEIDRVLSGALATRLGRPTAGLSRAELGDQLEASGLPRELGERAIAALEACDRARFAPGSGGSEQRTAAFEQAAELLLQIEKAPSGRGAAA